MKYIQQIPVSAILIAAIAFSFFGFADPSTPPQQSDTKKYFISLKDFRSEEVKGLGFSVKKDLSVHINGVGGGSRSFWGDEGRGKKSSSSDMYAYGWIINADTREVVWEMNMGNTSGKEDMRTCEMDLSLKTGSYEVYYSAHGYAKSSGMSFYSNNIDRRSGGRDNGGKFVEKFLGWFDEDYKDMYDSFMEKAKDSWGVYLSVPTNESDNVQIFNAPQKNPNTIFTATGIGDGAYVRKRITVNSDVTVNVYAIGEARGKEEVFDYGWITNTKTRERVWEMKYSNTEHAGGSSKNIMFNGDVILAQGVYELNFVTDDSHSRDDWNAAPPYDPFNYGVTINAKNERDRSVVTVTENNNEKKNVIVQLVKARDDEFLQAGFTLKEESRLHVYAIGEGNNSVHVRVMGKSVYDREDDVLADYGWIINAKTRERVWEMTYGNTEHAGGAKKNRLADEFITLPAGNYIVYYQTDDSHAYNDWNDDKPFDAESYGITVMGAGDNFAMKNVTKFEEGTDENVLVQMIKVRSDKHVRQKFTLDKAMKVRIYAIGEGEGRDMADYAWIENAKTGDVVWEMTYRTTTHAGGSKKNRLFDKPVYLDKGEYEVHYQTDDSHAFGDWNDDPPEDRTHWGVTIFKEQ